MYWIIEALFQAHPEKYILKRSAEFRAWLKMLRDNGKYLYVITGSHFDFASHVASYALGDDWKDLFDIVIFFARKPSFFWENRPFWRLEGPKEVESLEGWEDLETGDYYSQGQTQTRNIIFTSCPFFKNFSVQLDHVQDGSLDVLRD